MHKTLSYGGVQAHNNNNSPLLENHCVLHPTGLFADVRGDLIKKLESGIDDNINANHFK